MMTFDLVAAFVLSNAPFTLFVIALILACVNCFCPKTKREGTQLENFIALLFLLPIGIGGIWGFLVHTLFHNLADVAIGWGWSPFEFEVALANLAMGVLGICAFKASRSFRLAVALFVLIFGWGAAAGHVYQMVTANNFNPGNAGPIFYTDIFVPLFLWIFLLKQKH